MSVRIFAAVALSIVLFNCINVSALDLNLLQTSLQEFHTFVLRASQNAAVATATFRSNKLAQMCPELVIRDPNWSHIENVNQKLRELFEELLRARLDSSPSHPLHPQERDGHRRREPPMPIVAPSLPHICRTHHGDVCVMSLFVKLNVSGIPHPVREHFALPHCVSLNATEQTSSACLSKEQQLTVVQPELESVCQQLARDGIITVVECKASFQCGPPPKHDDERRHNNKEDQDHGRQGGSFRREHEERENHDESERGEPRREGKPGHSRGENRGDDKNQQNKHDDTHSGGESRQKGHGDDREAGRNDRCAGGESRDSRQQREHGENQREEQSSTLVHANGDSQADRRFEADCGPRGCSASLRFAPMIAGAAIGVAILALTGFAIIRLIRRRQNTTTNTSYQSVPTSETQNATPLVVVGPQGAPLFFEQKVAAAV